MDDNDPYAQRAADAFDDYLKDQKRPSTRVPILPYLGATIHLEGFDKCRVALCTGLSDNMAFVTIFAPNLPMQNGVLNGDGWHLLGDCTTLPAGSKF